MEPLALIACLTCICMAAAMPAADNGDDIKVQATRLVREYRRGRRQAFDEIVLLFQERIYNLTLNYVKQSEEARDLTQDIFVTVFRALPTLKDDTKFVAWLYQIAVNHCRNRYKRLQRRGFFNSLSTDEPEMPLHLTSDDRTAKKAEERDTMRLILATMDEMSDTDREILELRDLQELSYEEISHAMDLPLGTVKSRLNRARAKLKNRLKHLL